MSAPNAVIALSPNAPLVLPPELLAGAPAVIDLRVPDRTADGAVVRLTVEDSTGATLYELDNDSATGVVRTPALPAAAGLRVSVTAAGEDPAASGAAFDVLGVTGAGPVDLADVLRAQPVEPVPALASGSATVPASYFTSFDETGMSFFLSYIPWLYNRRIVAAAPIKQKAEHRLTGPYSAYLYEEILGTTSLETQNLPIPVNTASVRLGGWCFVGRNDVRIAVHLVVDGADSVREWDFEYEDVGSWVYRSCTLTLPVGARTFYGWIKLVPMSRLSSNWFYLDDYGVEFTPVVAPTQRSLLVGAVDGSLTALDLDAGGAQRWQARIGTGIIGAAPVTADGIAFVAAGTTLAAVETRSGRIVWSATLRAPVGSAPMLAGNACVVAGSDGWVRAYAKTTGALVWSVDVLGLSPGTKVPVNGTLVRDDVAYLSTNAGLAAVDLVARRVRWLAAPGKQFPFPAESGQGLVFAGAKDGSCTAFDAGTGAQRWSRDTGAPVQSEPQYLAGHVIVGNDSGVVYGLEAATGAVAWTLTPPNATAVRSFLYESGVLYVASNAIAGAFSAYALSVTSTGFWLWTRKWSVPVTNGAEADPVVAGSTVYFTGSDSTVRALDILSGKQRWSFTPPRVAFAGPATVVSPPTVDLGRSYQAVCWLGSHNAYANSEDGWFYAQQAKTIPRQLDDGVRALSLDIWNCPSSGDRVVYTHGGCALSWLLAPTASFKRFADSLGEIRDWLEQNPSEIVTLLIEERVANKALVMAAFVESGTADLVYRPDGRGPNDWNVETHGGWPTLAWLLRADRRLVVLSDWGRGWSWGDDGLPYVWQWAVENSYGDSSRDGTCSARAESSPLTSHPPYLFIANFNTSFSQNSRNSLDDGDQTRVFDDLNDQGLIGGFVDSCWGLRSRLPNVLLVDWYEYGHSGGPARAVADINARWALLP